MEEEKSKLKCTRCDHEIEIGQELFEVQEGVLGFRGVVPLEMPLVFCSAECVRKHFDNDNNGDYLPKHIP